MKRRNICIAAVILMIASASYYGALLHEKKSGNEDAASRDAAFHLAYSMDRETYGNFEAIGRETVSEERIYGGVTSHHLLAAGKIARFFAAFQGQEIKTVVIVGPNHFNTGNGNVLVSRYPYETPWGTVEPDTRIIDGLLAKKVARGEEEPFGAEHSISSLVSFVRYYLPDARIVPIIVKKNVTERQADKLAMALDEILPEDAVMIASVDFSHHLDKTAADFHDEKSIAAIANFDYEGVMTSEIDSPVSIRILLRYLEAREAKKMGWWESADSAELMEDVNYNDVTSYLFAHFAKGEEKEEKLISVLKFGNILAGADAAQTVADTFENMRGAEGNFLRGADLTTISISGDEDCRGALPAADLCGYMEKNNIGVVGITDNSIGRCGASETAALAKCLSQERIDYFGTSIGDGKSYAQEEIKGEKIVFISVTGSSADLKSVAELKKENGHVVADVRWSVGDSSQRQKNIAHALIDSGADAVFGSNLASVLPVEIYHGKAIFYSLGNMIGSLDTEGGASSIAVGAIFRKSGAKYYIFPFQGDDRVSSMMPPEDAAVFCGEYLMGMPEVERCGFELKAE